MDGYLELFNRLAKIIFESHINVLWQSTILVGSVFILLKIFKSINSKTKSIIYFVTLILVFTLPFINSLNLLTKKLYFIERPTSTMSSVENYKKYLELSNFEQIIVTLHNSSDYSSSIAPMDLPQLRLPNSSVNDIIFAIISIVTLLMLFNVYKGYGILKILKFSKKVPANFQKCFDSLVENSDRKKVRLFSTNIFNSPVTYGYFKPAICLPNDLFKQITEEEFELIIEHELQHIKNKDFIKNIFELIMTSVYFFNPAVRYLKNKINYERELTCDEYVIQNSKKKKQYLSVLMKIAEYTEESHCIVNPFIGKNKLLKRISEITKIKTDHSYKKELAAISFTCVFIALIMSFLVTNSNLIAFPSPSNESFSYTYSEFFDNMYYDIFPDEIPIFINFLPRYSNGKLFSLEPRISNPNGPDSLDTFYKNKLGINTDKLYGTKYKGKIRPSILNQLTSYYRESISKNHFIDESPGVPLLDNNSNLPVEFLNVSKNIKTLKYILNNGRPVRYPFFVKGILQRMPSAYIEDGKIDIVIKEEYNAPFEFNIYSYSGILLKHFEKKLRPSGVFNIILDEDIFKKNNLENDMIIIQIKTDKQMLLYKTSYSKGNRDWKYSNKNVKEATK